MYVMENPVLQRELLTNLRMTRAFVLLFAYVALLGGVVYLAWPQQQRLDLAQPEAAKRLVNLFFFGQYMLASLMAPSFAAGAITGEKERKSYEMLLASPLRPGAIVLGKLFAALCHLGILMICSLPIVMLCLPLGGVSLYEVFAAYFGMIASVGLFGMISLWASSYFRAHERVAGRVVPADSAAGDGVRAGLESIGAAGRGAAAGRDHGRADRLRFALGADVATTPAAGCCIRPTWAARARRSSTWRPRPARRSGCTSSATSFPTGCSRRRSGRSFMEEGANPIYDKEMRSEIFSQGTLMLRLVIQISMLLALFVMAVCLYIAPQLAPWYISYVLLFNMLVGPVFSAGSVTSERERQTLDLLLTTLVTPWQMLWGKLLSGLRVSSVLTSFLLWPVLLACVMPLLFWSNLPTMVGVLADRRADVRDDGDDGAVLFERFSRRRRRA